MTGSLLRHQTRFMVYFRRTGEGLGGLYWVG
jgi:hypothetical protein